MDDWNAPYGQKRLRTALLAFPLAGLVGFGGSVLIRSVWPDDASNARPSTISPRPSGTGSNRHLPTEQRKPVRPASTGVNRTPTA
ncbi:MAG TPA: hypothetical protein VK595_10890 [Vicinamibacterales bacterium]|nr:hypothetical protein [Vicinamibacterales bacterium]